MDGCLGEVGLGMESGVRWLRTLSIGLWRELSKRAGDESARIIIQNDELYGRQTSLLRLGCVCQTEVGIEAELMGLG